MCEDSNMPFRLSKKFWLGIADLDKYDLQQTQVMVNKKILSRSVRSILGYFEVTEPEYAINFFKLGLVFEILSARIFSEKLLSTVYNTVL